MVSGVGVGAHCKNTVMLWSERSETISNVRCGQALVYYRGENKENVTLAVTSYTFKKRHFFGNVLLC